MNIIKASEFSLKPFQMIGDEWMLITAEKDGRINTMTASWGGIGVLWNMNVAYIFIRASRYTKEFVDGSDYFSLSFLEHSKYAKQLAYLGSASGRDEDKINVAGVNVAHYEGVPYIEEASSVIVCRKLFRQLMSPENFLDANIDSAYYADKDYHDLYVGEIIGILER